MWRKATIGGLAALAIVAGGAGVTIAHAAQTSTGPTVATADPTPSPTAPHRQARQGAQGRQGRTRRCEADPREGQGLPARRVGHQG